MGKKLIIPGADFSENCILIPLTIVVKAGGSVTIGGVEYTAGAEDKEYEINSVPSNFSLNYENDIKYLRVGSTTTLNRESGVFRNNGNLEEVKFIADVYTSGIANVMFANCSKLKSFDGSHLYYVAANASQLFYCCSKIKNVNLPHITGTISSMASMFAECTELERVDFGNLTFSNDVVFTDMFKLCPALKTINAPSLVASDYNVTGTDTYKFIQGISATTGNVTIQCGTGSLTWNGSTWTVNS